jgi:hypothetical protein
MGTVISQGIGHATAQGAARATSIFVPDVPAMRNA